MKFDEKNITKHLHFVKFNLFIKSQIFYILFLRCRISISCFSGNENMYCEKVIEK